MTQNEQKIQYIQDKRKEAKEKKDGPKRDFYFFMIRVLLIGSM